MNTAHILLLLALIVACCLAELHPRVRSTARSSATLGLIAVCACIRLGSQLIDTPAPASLWEYILTAALLYGVVAYLLHARTSPSTRASLDRWHITS